MALDDAEDTAKAEAILRANEPQVSWENLDLSISRAGLGRSIGGLGGSGPA